MALQDFLLIRSGEEQYLLLRWSAGEDHPIDSFRFVLEQLDGGGRVLAVSVHTCGGASTTSVGGLFVLEEGILVNTRCSDVRVRLLEVCSEGFVYRPDGDTFQVDFECESPWIYEKRSRRRDRLTTGIPLRVISKRSVHGKFLWVGALIAAVALIAVPILAVLSEM